MEKLDHRGIESTWKGACHYWRRSSNAFQIELGNPMPCCFLLQTTVVLCVSLLPSRCVYLEVTAVAVTNYSVCSRGSISTMCLKALAFVFECIMSL